MAYCYIAVVFQCLVVQDIVCLHGTGVIIDADVGLILTGKGTVPQRLADVEVSLKGES